MAQAAAALRQPQTIKISSKRQITIPAGLYKAAGFKNYALCTWTEDGLLIQPLDIDSEDSDVTVDILKRLVSAGYEGDELVEQYKLASAKVVSLKERLRVAEGDVVQGNVTTARELAEHLRADYGLHS